MENLEYNKFSALNLLKLPYEDFFFRYFEINYLKIFLMLCNRFFCTLCKLYNPLLPSESQDWVFKVIIDFLGPLQIFNNFSTDFFTSFKLLYLYKKYP